MLGFSQVSCERIIFKLDSRLSISVVERQGPVERYGQQVLLDCTARLV